MKRNFKLLIKYLLWIFVLIILGLVCGVIGTLFSKNIAFVTNLRAENGWLIYLLPLGGIITVAVVNLFKVNGVGTNQVFESTVSNKKVSVLLTPMVFICSVITHLLGGSAGREGAALQLGGGTGTFFANIFKCDEEKKRILILCGMASFFSAIFGTPIGACVFVLEVVVVGKVCVAAIFPVFLSGITAYLISQLLGAHAERFFYDTIPDFSSVVLIKVVLLIFASVGVGVIFCKSLHFTEGVFSKYLKNNYLKAILGGGIIVLLTVICGTKDYNGGGVDVIKGIFTSGEVKYEAFLLKIVFTVITVAAGFKGGEIIPTFFIGSTFGAAFACVLNLDLSFGAAVGMTVLFCTVTNSPLATLILAIEMFGSNGTVYYALASIIAFAFSGKCSLYSAQQFEGSKLLKV